VLVTAYATHPERFTAGPPNPPARPVEVWINPPKTEFVSHSRHSLVRRARMNGNTEWREYDPADAVRLYALRLREVGLKNWSPRKLLAQGTDWRFLSELKKELKG
jgi:hypothetical protein